MARTPELVDDYPRPPIVDAVRMRAEVWVGEQRVAATDDVVRVLETWHPPGIYLPREAFAAGVLRLARDARTTACEWKGVASYLDLHVDGATIERAAWTYERPLPGYEAIAGRVSVYPGRVTRCVLGGEDVVPQEGSFYGGWITSWIDGRVKGAPGTTHW